ncbi:MAG: metallophosphoesterase [Candidatus Aenigmatarchaeota archaeon]
MKIFDELKVVNSYPALYIDEIDAVVVSDLHLGLESLMSESGTLVPKFQLSEVEDELGDILRSEEPERLIICGDIKHQFSETSFGEREEIERFIDFVTGSVEEILLVKGNHDNFLIHVTKDYDSVDLDEVFEIGRFSFVHGHEYRDVDTQYLVIGHEHPAIGLKDDIDVEEKIPCFLYGENERDQRIVVLPAFTKLSEGSPLNRSRDSILSPFLKKEIDVGDMKAIGVDREAGLFEFPEIRKLEGF